jgi:hypothetical protein
VGVYATAAKTALIFRQIVGRFVRTIPGRAVEPSWLYIPADAALRDHAASIEEELRAALRSPNEEGFDAELERDQRRETEPSPELEFVPLSADVAPQLTLFGPTPSASPTAPIAWPATVPSLVADGGAPTKPELELPAFERRARLRDERHRLVSEVRRRDGASHREINSWLNRKLGITSVEEATLEDLERSVELLVTRLTSRR